MAVSKPGVEGWRCLWVLGWGPWQIGGFLVVLIGIRKITGTPNTTWEGLRGASAPWNPDSGVKAGKGQRKVQEVKTDRENFHPSLPRLVKA